jgi:hypothetical protein
MLATLAAALAVSIATRTVVGAQHGLPVCGTDNASQKCTTHQPMGAERLQTESRYQTADPQAQAAHTYCRVKTTSQAWPGHGLASSFINF